VSAQAWAGLLTWAAAHPLLVIWCAWGLGSFACGMTLAILWRWFRAGWDRAGQQAGELAAGKPDLLDELAARQAAGRLGHQDLAWPPHGIQLPKVGPPPSKPVPPPPPAPVRRSHAATDWALWAEEMKQR
jgi:hypothetical protein